MCDPVSITTAIVGMASSAYSQNRQKEAMRSAERRQEAAEVKARDEAEAARKKAETPFLFAGSDRRAKPVGRSRFALRLFDDQQTAGSSVAAPPTLGVSR